ncbi:MAG: divalent-cation tolerance protein CutA [Elusimicrobia bacterium]|nr:divalent-cation tolerance protein CutA [Elusimicrobiota bacterium]
MEHPYQFVITAVPDAAENSESGGRKAAEVISQGLLQQKLAACVSAIGPVTSQYWWKDKLETTAEIILLIKTKATLFPDVQQFIREHHPYELPEIVALDIADGSADYLTWIGAACRYSPRANKEETRQSREQQQ